MHSESQLWIATHSIGMMRKARELALSDPGSVAFLDFGDRKFDGAVRIEPTRPTRRFWEQVLHVAVSDLAELVAPNQVIICEGNPITPVAGKNGQLDAEVYNEIFADEFPDAKFLSAGSSLEVLSDRLSLVAGISSIARGIAILRLIDRDDHSSADISNFNANGVRVLSMRNIESFLFHDDVLLALCEKFGKPELGSDLLKAKENAMMAAHGRGYAIDDVKPARGDIYVAAKRLLHLTAVGNDAVAFMKQILAPLVPTTRSVYSILRMDVFGK